MTTKEFIEQMISSAESDIAWLKRELASFEVDAQPQTPTKGE